MKEFDEYIIELSRDKSEQTLRSYKTKILKFLNYFKIEIIEDMKVINRKDVIKYQDYLISTGMENSSINSDFLPIKAFINWMVDNDYLDRNVFALVKALKQNKDLPIFLTEKEQELIIEACKDDKENLNMVLLMLNTGLRRSEIVSLKVSDISNDRHLTVRSEVSKGKKERKIFLNDTIWPIFEKFIYSFPREYVFNSKTHGGQIDGGTVEARLKAILIKAGISSKRIEKLTAHKLRHTFATNLVSKKVPLNVIQGLLGHESQTTAMHYAHVRDSVADEAVGQL